MPTCSLFHELVWCHFSGNRTATFPPPASRQRGALDQIQEAFPLSPPLMPLSSLLSYCVLHFTVSKQGLLSWRLNVSLEHKHNVHMHDHPNDFSSETTSLQGNLSVHSSMPCLSSKVSRETLPVPMQRSLMLGSSLSVVFVQCQEPLIDPQVKPLELRHQFEAQVGGVNFEALLYHTVVRCQL